MIFSLILTVIVAIVAVFFALENPAMLDEQKAKMTEMEPRQPRRKASKRS